GAEIRPGPASLARERNAAAPEIPTSINPRAIAAALGPDRSEAAEKKPSARSPPWAGSSASGSGRRSASSRSRPSKAQREGLAFEIDRDQAIWLKGAASPPNSQSASRATGRAARAAAGRRAATTTRKPSPSPTAEARIISPSEGRSGAERPAPRETIPQAREL